LRANGLHEVTPGKGHDEADNRSSSMIVDPGENPVEKELECLTPQSIT
jgi:hypothetical protein